MPENNSKTNDTFWEKHGHTIIFFIILLAVAGAWWYTYYSLHCDIANRGTFGDMFGGLNALFSGLAFSGVIFAILLQRKELSLQREELKMTHHELKGQKEQLESHSEAFQLQNFENTFFAMLHLQNTLVNTISAPGGKKSSTLLGKDAFRTLFEELGKIYGAQIGKNSNNNNSGPSMSLKDFCNNFYGTPSREMRHYFRSIMDLFEFVHNSQIEHKIFYCQIAKHQLTENELILFFYFCISKYARESFKEIIPVYSIFENIQINMLCSTSADYSLFPPEAYGDNFLPELISE